MVSFFGGFHRSLIKDGYIGLKSKCRCSFSLAWLQRLSNSPSPLVAPTVPLSTCASSDTVAMTSNLVIQSPEDQLLHWRQDMEKKHEEQARQMRELQDRVEHPQRENDHLQAQVEKMHNLGERDVQDNGQARQPAARDKGKEPIVPGDVDTSANDELSLGSLPNLSPTKNNRVKSRQRHLHRPAFSNADNGMFCRARRETGRGQTNQTKCLGTRLHYQRE